MSNPETVRLVGYAAWQDFVDENRDALVDQFGTIYRAELHARTCGFHMGGGAGPEVFVTLDLTVAK